MTGLIIPSDVTRGTPYWWCSPLSSMPRPLRHLPHWPGTPLPRPSHRSHLSFYDFTYSLGQYILATPRLHYQPSPSSLAPHHHRTSTCSTQYIQLPSFLPSHPPPLPSLTLTSRATLTSPLLFIAPRPLPPPTLPSNRKIRGMCSIGAICADEGQCVCIVATQP